MLDKLIEDAQNSAKGALSGLTGKTNQPGSKRGTIVGTPYAADGITYVDVRVKDDRGKPAVMQRVRLEESRTGMVAPLSTGDPVDLKFADPDDASGLNPAKAVASRASDKSITGNQAIPANMVGKIDSSTLLKGNNNVCIGMRDASKKLQQLKSSLYKKDSLVMLQNPRSGSHSAGLAVSRDGELAFFDKTGQNKTTMDGNGITQKAKDIDTTDSNRSRTNAMYGGLPSMESFAADFTPKSNVFMPTMTHIPHITKIVLMIGMARALIGIGKLAKDGLKEMKRMQDEIKQQEQMEELERQDALQAILEGRGTGAERAAALEKLLGEKSYYTDKDRINKLKETEILRALIPVLQDGGQISADDLTMLEAYVSHEQKELKSAGSTRTKRSMAFDRIADEAGRKAKEMVLNERAKFEKDPLGAEQGGKLGKTTVNIAALTAFEVGQAATLPKSVRKIKPTT